MIPAVRADVEEVPFLEVAIEGCPITAKGRDDQLGPAVAVEVLGVDAHASLVFAGLVAGGARGLGDVLEGPVTPIEEQEVGALVVGDVEVDLAVAVQVGGDDAHPATVPASSLRPSR